MADGCTEMELLLQADLDGELTPAEAARVAAHVPSCPQCSERQAELLSLSRALQGLQHALPVGLETRIRAQLAALQPKSSRKLRTGPVLARRWAAGSFAAGFALAASLALAVLLPRGEAGLVDGVVASHIRALQPGHLMDVASSDQHTVKPWFDGRIDFAPPVKDLTAARFPLLGGRLDYLGGRPVAALVYGRDKHLIDLYIWPGTSLGGNEVGSQGGYNVRRWAVDGMVFWAVSDLNAAELADFAARWRAG